MNMPTNYAKKIAKLYYQDRIWELSQQGKSVRDITHYVNTRCIPHTKFKGIILSRSTIHTIIKKDIAK